MSSESEVLLGGMYLDGEPRAVPHRYTNLFNSCDRVTAGTPGDNDYYCGYRITAQELRRRLDMIGATLPASVASFRAVVDAAAKDALDIDVIRYASFFVYAKALSDDELVSLVRGAYDSRHDEKDFYSFELDFGKNVVSLLLGQGCIYLEDDSAPLWRGYVFEAIACTFLDADAALELDITRLVTAGYYSPFEDPVGNAFDEQVSALNPSMLILGNVVGWEENEECEFKSVQSTNPINTIRDLLARYVISFMNQTGGSLFFGISDDGRVEGVRLDRMQRDDLSRAINQELAAIVPKVALDGIHIRYRPVVGSAHVIADTFVIEIKVPQGPSHEMYFRSNVTWVRFGTESRKLEGHDLFVHVLAAYRTVMLSRDRSTSADPVPPN